MHPRKTHTAEQLGLALLQPYINALLTLPAREIVDTHLTTNWLPAPLRTRQYLGANKHGVVLVITVYTCAVRGSVLLCFAVCGRPGGGEPDPPDPPGLRDRGAAGESAVTARGGGACCPSPDCAVIRPWNNKRAYQRRDRVTRQFLVATLTQTQRNPIVKANQKGRICHTPVSHWLFCPGYVGVEFTLQITFGA